MDAPDHPTAPLTIRLFGPFEVQVNGAALPRLRSRKGQWLLALLALRAGQEVDRSWLAGTLWPDSPASQALVSLRNSLTDLRQALGTEADRLQSPKPRTLSLDLSGAAVDVVAFDRGMAENSFGSLEEAVGLYRGPLLEACGEEWVLQERQAREQAYLQARETLADHALEAGDLGTAERHLRQAVTVDPLRESAQRTLMQALAAGGNYAAALLVYRELRLQLHRELNAEPDPQTTALFHQLRAEARHRAQSPPPAPENRPAEFPPLRSLDARPCNLPAQTTPLLGREQEVAAAVELLRRDTLRLLTLTGPGGSGKTRLGLEVAAGLLNAFEDDIYFVDLAPIRDPDRVASTIARTLGVREAEGRPLRESLQDYLRQQQLLLLLDNFEQVLAAAPLVSELLAAAPRLKVLVTSRAPLHLHGEQEFPVPPLALPDPRSLPPVPDLWQYGAIQLFVERARAVKPDFDLTNENAAAVVKICCRLDGLPLAIELAAARLKLFSPQALLSRLEPRLKLLTGGARDLPARLQTLEGAIAWSYDLLEEGEQRLFRRLAVFRGGCTLEAAEAVCGDRADGGATRQRTSRSRSRNRPSYSYSYSYSTRSVLDGLASLVDQSLLWQEEAAGGEPRFLMLETIREYGLERLVESGEAAALQRQHAQFFLTLAEAAELKLQSGERFEWLQRLEAEYSNLQAALAWTQAAPESGETGLRLAGSLADFWDCRGSWSEGCGWLEAALGRRELKERTPVPRLRPVALREPWAKALRGLGHLAHCQGDVETAHSLLGEAVAIWREVGDKRSPAYWLAELAWLKMDLDDLAAARAFLDESMTVAREVGDHWGFTISLIGLGLLAMHQGAPEEARSHFEEALAISREYRYEPLVAWSLFHLAGAAVARGDCREACALYEESLGIFRKLSDRPCIAESLGHLGKVAVSQGDFEMARDHYEESLAIFREMGDRRGISECLQGLARMAVAQRQAARAARLLGAAEALREARGGQLSFREREEYERDLAVARSRLGEHAFAAAWAEGRAMPVEQAVAYAMRGADTASSAPV